MLFKTDDDAVAIGLPAAPVSVKHWDMDAAMAAKRLSYAEQVLVFSLQGLVNQLGAPPVLSIDAGFQDFDWVVHKQSVFCDFQLFFDRQSVTDCL